MATVRERARILIVDDDPGIRDVLEIALDGDEYVPISVEDGESALNMLRNDHIDVVLLDIGLPDIDGFEVCTRARQFSDVPILMLTARGSPQDVVRGLRTGADDYVRKPFQLEELIARIDAVRRRGEWAASGEMDGQP